MSQNVSQFLTILQFWPFLCVFCCCWYFWLFGVGWGSQEVWGWDINPSPNSKYLALPGGEGLKKQPLVVKIPPHMFQNLFCESYLPFSNCCLEEEKIDNNLTFHHFRHTRTYLKLTIVSLFSLIFLNLSLREGVKNITCKKRQFYKGKNMGKIFHK